MEDEKEVGGASATAAEVGALTSTQAEAAARGFRGCGEAAAAAGSILGPSERP